MTSEQIRRWAAAGVLAGALGLYGCGSKDDVAASPTPTGTPTQAATPDPPSAALPAGLRGSWKRTMTAREWRPAGRGYPLGTWRFDVDAHGGVNFYYPRKDTVDFTTELVVTGQQLTVEMPVCPGQTGRYKWRASARALKLTLVGRDACLPRAALLGGTWTRRR
jgi:hypothetical protein